MSDHSETSGLQPPLEHVALRDMAIASLMFDSLTSYNRSLAEFREKAKKYVDLVDDGYCRVLLKWLNDWGCRHLAKDQHEVASDSILRWYKAEAEKLAVADKPLWLLDDTKLKQAADAYGALKDLPGANRTRNGEVHVATIGPTAASKILFALRPHAFAPWDDGMRKHFGCDGGAESYRKFLGIVKALTIKIATQCERNDFFIEYLPHELRRDGATVVSLLNEYLWVTIPPSASYPQGRPSHSGRVGDCRRPSTS